MDRVTLAADGDRVVVDPADGRIASALLGGRERLVAAPPTHVVPAADAHLQWGVYVMAPWAGRIADGRLAWGGRTHQLPTTAEGHALHGVCHDRAWRVRSAGTDHVVLTRDLDDTPWPLGGEVRHELRLADGTLRCELAVTAADAPMPAWVGWHPCFARPSAPDRDLRLTLAADEVLETEAMIPTGRRSPVAGELDLRDGPELGERRLDHTYVRPRTPAVLAWDDLTLELGFDTTTHAVVVYTPAHTVCVEPQTAWPDALRLDRAGVASTGLARLGPHATLTTTMTWRWTTR